VLRRLDGRGEKSRERRDITASGTVRERTPRNRVVEGCGPRASLSPQSRLATMLPPLSANRRLLAELVWGTKGRRFESGRPDSNPCPLPAANPLPAASRPESRAENGQLRNRRPPRSRCRPW
jgi:hypothetical protein